MSLSSQLDSELGEFKLSTFAASRRLRGHPAAHGTAAAVTLTVTAGDSAQPECQCHIPTPSQPGRLRAIEVRLTERRAIARHLD